MSQRTFFIHPFGNILFEAIRLSFFRWLFGGYFDHLTEFIGPDMIQLDFESKLTYAF